VRLVDEVGEGYGGLWVGRQTEERPDHAGGLAHAVDPVGALDGGGEEHLTDPENLAPEIHRAGVPDCPDREAPGQGLGPVHYCAHDHRVGRGHPDSGRDCLAPERVGDRPFPTRDARHVLRRNHLVRPVRLVRPDYLVRLPRLSVMPVSGTQWRSLLTMSH
jgi:hypothetical protein